MRCYGLLSDAYLIFARISAKGLRMSVMFSIIFLLTGCFTGIESTKKITMTKSELREAVPTAEDLFLSGLKANPDTSWAKGKVFVVTGDRAGLLFEPKRIVSCDFNLHAGDTLRYLESGIVTLPDGNRVRALGFSRGEDVFRYMPVRGVGNDPVMSDVIPGVVDPAMLEEAERLMAGKTLWTLSPVWETISGELMDGRKYEKVTIQKIVPGTMVFPARVIFSDESGSQGSMLMSFGNSGNESRSFPNLFRLTDPRGDYPSISDEVWESVKRGNVICGMTKDECRLSKGNPKEVNNGKDYQHTIMIWTYQDGTVLYFVDDILRGINTIPKDKEF